MMTKYLNLIFGIILIMILSSCNSFNEYQKYSKESPLFPIGINGKWGYVDETGTERIKLQFSDAKLFHYELAIVEIDGKYGYINTDGELKIKPKYERAEDFYVGCAKVQQDGKTEYINRKGKPIKYKDCELSQIQVGCLVPQPPIDPGRYSVRKGDKYALTYKQVKDTTEYIFDSVNKFSHDFLLVEKDGKFGFHYIYVPREYDGKVYHPFNKEFVYDTVRAQYSMWNDEIEVGRIRFAEVKREGLWGVINWKLDEVVVPKYLKMERDLTENYIKVEYEPKKYGYIDYQGKEYFKREK